MTPQEFLQTFLIGVLSIGLSFLLLFVFLGFINGTRVVQVDYFEDAANPELSGLLNQTEKTLRVSQWEQFCAMIGKVKEGLINAEKADKISDAEAEDRVNKNLAKELPEGVPKCPLEFPRDELKTVDKLDVYLQKIPPRFLVQLHATTVYCVGLLQQKVKDIQAAITGVDGFDGTVPQCPVPCSCPAPCAAGAGAAGQKPEPTPSKEPMAAIPSMLNKITGEYDSYIQQQKGLARPAEPLDVLLRQGQAFLAELAKVQKQAEDGTLPRPGVDSPKYKSVQVTLQ